MISDLFFILASVVVDLIGVAMSPFILIFNTTQMTPEISTAMVWLFHPLTYFGYWIDLQGLGRFIMYLMEFFMLWYFYQLIRFVISLFRPHIEQPEL